jgi:hypothetical protein
MTQPLERFGTPEFMAPELLLDPRDAKPSADVFSIGRIAAWGTGLLRDEGGQREDQLTGWWQRLIEGAAAYEPKLRWTMREVLTHLRGQPHVVSAGRITSRAGVVEACPRCGSGVGRDGAERCLSCHWLSDE